MAVSQASKNNSDSQLQNSPFIAVLFIQDSSTSTYNIYSLLIASPANEPRNEPSLIPNIIIIIIPQSDADDDVAHHKCTQIMPTIKAAELHNTKPPTHIFNILFFYKTDSLILCVTLNLASESQFIDFLPHPNFTLPLEYFISFPQLFLWKRGNRYFIYSSRIKYAIFENSYDGTLKPKWAKLSPQVGCGVDEVPIVRYRYFPLWYSTAMSQL